MKAIWQRVKCFFGRHPRTALTFLRDEQGLLFHDFRIHLCNLCGREAVEKKEWPKQWLGG